MGKGRSVLGRARSSKLIQLHFKATFCFPSDFCVSISQLVLPTGGEARHAINWFPQTVIMLSCKSFFSSVTSEFAPSKEFLLVLTSPGVSVTSDTNDHFLPSSSFFFFFVFPFLAILFFEYFICSTSSSLPLNVRLLAYMLNSSYQSLNYPRAVTCFRGFKDHLLSDDTHLYLLPNVEPCGCSYLIDLFVLMFHEHHRCEHVLNKTHRWTTLTLLLSFQLSHLIVPLVPDVRSLGVILGSVLSPSSPLSQCLPGQCYLHTRFN